jgi:hypothetical protein
MIEGLPGSQGHDNSAGRCARHQNVFATKTRCIALCWCVPLPLALCDSGGIGFGATPDRLGLGLSVGGRRGHGRARLEYREFGVPRAWDGVTFIDSDKGARENDDRYENVPLIVLQGWQGKGP